jgi:hypothetical protein
MTSPHRSPGRTLAGDIAAQSSAARLKRWVIGDALPLWGETGFDSTRGSFVERLTFEGAPLVNAPRRAMVQARQIYVFSHAALLGWRPEGKAIALEAVHGLIDRSYGVDGDHGWVFPFTPTAPSTTRSAIFMPTPSPCSGSPGLTNSSPSRGFVRRARDARRARAALRLPDRRLSQRSARRLGQP